jgi:hypothetical protein
VVSEFDDTYCHTNRRKDVRVITINLDKEALEILRDELPPGNKHVGAFMSRLLYEHRARREERAKVRAGLLALVEVAGE